MSFGDGRQFNGLVAPPAPLTLNILRLKSVPDPFNGVIPSFEKAEKRNVRSEPGPANVFALTVQLVPVRPAAWPGGEAKLTTVGS